MREAKKPQKKQQKCASKLDESQTLTLQKKLAKSVTPDKLALTLLPRAFVYLLLLLW